MRLGSARESHAMRSSAAARRPCIASVWTTRTSRLGPNLSRGGRFDDVLPFGPAMLDAILVHQLALHDVLAGQAAEAVAALAFGARRARLGLELDELPDACADFAGRLEDHGGHGWSTGCLLKKLGAVTGGWA